MAVLFYCAGKVKFVEVEKELNKKQIGKRLLQVLIVLFGISFLTLIRYNKLRKIGKKK